MTQSGHFSIIGASLVALQPGVRPNCGSLGCAITVYASLPDGTYTKALSNIVRNYTFHTIHGRPAEELSFAGDYASCHKDPSTLCKVTAYWNGKEFARPGYVQGDASYVGRWAENPDLCLNQAGSSDDTTRVTKRGMEAPETSCRFDRIRGGEGRWRIAMTCQGEGMTNREQAEFRVTGGALQIKYLDRHNATAHLARCRQ